MTSSEAKEKFESLLAQRTENDSAQALVSCMIDFYRDERADDCLIEEDGDMLLYQWGTYDWGQGRWFDLNITRQFIRSGEDADDDDIFQLSITAKFEPSPKSDALTSGNRWCNSPDELSDFTSFITNGKPILQFGSVTCDNIEIRYECAG